MCRKVLLFVACLLTLVTCKGQNVQIRSDKSVATQLHSVIVKHKLSLIALEKALRESTQKETSNSAEDSRKLDMFEMGEMVHKDAVFCYHFEFATSMLMAFEDRPNIAMFQNEAANRIKVQISLLNIDAQSIDEIRVSTKDSFVQQKCDEIKEAIERFSKDLDSVMSRLVSRK